MDKKLKSKKKPWPTKKAMEQVYEMNLWGGKEFDFYSGEGSHNLELVTPYIKQSVFLIRVNLYVSSFSYLTCSLYSTFL